MNVAENVFIMKTAKNRGCDRIWLEGKKLANAGFQRGDMLEKTIDDRSLVLRRVSNPIAGNKYHRIAGTLNRPILDCCGKWVTQLFKGAESYSAAIDSRNGTITISPCKGE